MVQKTSILVARMLAVPALCLLAGCGGGAEANGEADIAVAVAAGDHCPSITSAVAAPNQTSVGSAISVTATAMDPDPADRLSYSWGPATGFANPSAAATSFTCAAPGRQSLRVAVSDNHGPTPCVATASVTVDCLAR